MLRFVQKAEVWAAEDAGLDQEIGATTTWGLKSAQDLMAYSHLRDARDLHIAEIGGGQSRLLPALARTNTCFNIEAFEGENNGPRKEILLDQVTNIHAYVGKFDPVIEDGAFEVVFSVSVVEHVATEDLPAFFADCARMLKPGGRMVHLVDVYLRDQSPKDERLARRIQAYRQPFDDGLFEPLEEPLIGSGDLWFRCGYVTHPDPEMRKRNLLAPSLARLRTNAQSCSIIMSGLVNSNRPRESRPHA